MDDTNKTNQPLDSNALPGPLPPTPPIEDITPAAEPTVAPASNTTFTTTVTTPTIEPQIKTEWDLPEPTPAVSAPPTTTFTTTVSTPAPEPTPLPQPKIETPLPQPTADQPMADTPMPTGKPKGKISPIVGGLVALLLVVGVAGAAYYVSNQLSTRQAVAPTAPESEPMAAESTQKYNEICRKNCNTNVKNCYAASGSKGGRWKTRACGTSGCGSSAQRKVISEACGANGISVMYFTKCEKTAACIASVVANLPDEVTDKEDGVITFEKVGWVSVAWSGKAKMTLTPVTSGSPVVIATDSAGLNITKRVLEITTAGTQYKVSLSLDNEAKDAYGFRSPLDAEETKCGQNDPKYGAQIDISTVKGNVSQQVSLDGVSPSSIECWGDSLAGDVTQDYDFNDRTVFIGYEGTNTVVGACTDIKVYRKVNGAYGTTALTKAQLGTLSVGDVLKFALTSNTDNLQGRFGVKLGTGTTTWLTGTIDATNKKLVTYSNYTVAAAGTYRFEAQVSTTP